MREQNIRPGDLIFAPFDYLLLLVFRIGVIVAFPFITMRYLRLTDQTWLPDPAFPRTVNDKYFWRKVFDHNPDFPIIADKVRARDWLKEKGATIKGPPTLWIGTRPEDMPDEFYRPGVMLKVNPGSGWNLLLKDPLPDRDTVNADLNALLGRTYGKQWHEPFYFDIPPALIAEEFLPEVTTEMKFYTFGDQIARVYVAQGGYQTKAADIWKTGADGKLYVSDDKSPSAERTAGLPLPPVAEEAAQVARFLGQHFDHIRVDILTDGTTLWFGELTIANLGGHVDGVSASSVETMNAAWDIRKSWFLSTRQTGRRGIYARALLRRLNARSA
ncbi:MAG: hypothetical protein KJP02_09760 [Octadecabacter sp.]|nr:hypothetical protein [Octadecabacter sp.]